MKRVYAASLCKNGLLGGSLYVDDEKIAFRTGKLTVPLRIRNLELHFKNVVGIRKERILILPVAAVSMKNGEEWKFFVLRRNDFVRMAESLITSVQ